MQLSMLAFELLFYFHQTRQPLTTVNTGLIFIFRGMRSAVVVVDLKNDVKRVARENKAQS